VPAKLAALAALKPHLHFTGRLGTYKYYNMDQVVAQSLALYRRLSNATPVSLAAEVAGACEP